MRQVLTDTENMINRDCSVKEHIAYLKSLQACSESIAYAEQYDSMREAWEACRRPDWMLWLLSHVGHQDDRVYRRYACWCVRNTPLPDGRKAWDMLTDERSRAAVAVAEQFADGAAGDQELAAARASADASADAADAAAYAARSAYYAAADAADAAAYAAAADAAYAARSAAAAARSAVVGSAADAAAYAAYASAYAAAAASDRASTTGAARAAADAAHAAALCAQSSYLREVIPWHVIEPLLSI